MSSLFHTWLGFTQAAARTGAQETEPAAEYQVARPATRTRSTRPPTVDAQLAAAVEQAREALLEVVPAEQVGEHLGVKAEGQRLVAHYFACTDPAYRGWRWTTVLARAPRAKKVTVCETALLPGEEALLAPEWLPWEDRLQPGDLSAKDTLPKREDDPNLVYGFEQVDLTDDDDIDQIPNFELGLGRKRVLSNYGIANAARRWEDSEGGPDNDFARGSSAQCGSCGFLLPLTGALRTQFGVCANEWSPFDGRVVSLDSGCGAHSETDVRRQAPAAPEAVVDDFAGDFEMVEHAGS